MASSWHSDTYWKHFRALNNHLTGSRVGQRSDTRGACVLRLPVPPCPALPLGNCLNLGSREEGLVSSGERSVKFTWGVLRSRSSVSHFTVSVLHVVMRILSQVGLPPWSEAAGLVSWRLNSPVHLDALFLLERGLAGWYKEKSLCLGEECPNIQQPNPHHIHPFSSLTACHRHKTLIPLLQKDQKN